MGVEELLVIIYFLFIVIVAYVVLFPRSIVIKSRTHGKMHAVISTWYGINYDVYSIDGLSWYLGSGRETMNIIVEVLLGRKLSAMRMRDKISEMNTRKR